MLHNHAFEKINDRNYESKLPFSDKLISNFLSFDQNMIYLLNAVAGDDVSKRELEIRFRKFFFRIRFVKYLSSTINYSLIDQIRYHKKIDQRDILIFDQPLSAGEDKSGTIGELPLLTPLACSSTSSLL